AGTAGLAQDEGMFGLAESLVVAAEVFEDQCGFAGQRGGVERAEPGVYGVRGGMRVLDAGTGTGETATLLAHRCGATNITTIDVDPAVSAAARERLCTLGLYAEAVTGDALAGHPDRGPYDRLLCTFGVRSSPRAWVEQVRPGGVIVAAYGTHYSSRDAAARLTVHAEATASGPIVTAVEFMKARSRRTVWPDAEKYVKQWPGSTGTAVQPDQLAEAHHAISLAVPHVAHTTHTEPDGAPAAWWYFLTDRSWAAVRWPEEYGPGIIFTVTGGWSPFSQTTAADFTGDGKADLIARDDNTADLRSWAGHNDATFASPTTLTSGW
ncbi:methyltransferase domain-containing protein, partial [Streptomyces sp. NPDC006514]|uniref:methyltransferase domain-containing protein n=1 Tax=Streptomyces sp. NPDC006514 TaxID=3154308 RepID=UPI0033BF2558